MKDIICSECDGDGISRCNNPDHGFIEGVGGELQRLGCPVCGHNEDFKVRHWNAKDNKYEWEKCDTCNGFGVIMPTWLDCKIILEGDKFREENGHSFVEGDSIKPTELHKFIYEEEPIADTKTEYFRERLANLIKFLIQ